MRRTVLVLFCALAARSGETDLSRRIDTLVARWRHGDEAARAGVVAETKALGDEALAALFRRVAAPVDFPARDPGVPLPAGKPGDRGDAMVLVEVRFGEPKDPVVVPITRVRLLTAAEARALEGNLDVISAPRLTVYDGQRANITVLKQQNYVRTHDAEKRPVTGVVSSGLLLETRPRLAKDGKAITLELRCVSSELKEPMARVESGAGQVDVPEVLKREMALTLQLDDGGRATMALPRGDGRPLVVSIHARRITLDAEAVRRDAPKDGR